MDSNLHTIVECLSFAVVSQDKNIKTAKSIRDSGLYKIESDI